MTAYMVWKGYQDEGIYLATCDNGVNWSDQIPIPGIGTARGPVIESAHGMIWMAWRGADNDEGIWWSRFDSSYRGGYFPQWQLPRAYTSDSPHLVYYQDQIWCFWKGPEGDNTIWRAKATIEGGFLNWDDPRNFTLDLDLTDKSPRLTVGRVARLYLAGKNARDQGIFVTWSDDGENWLDSSGSTIVNVPRALTSSAPTLMETVTSTGNPDYLLMVFKGQDGDDGIYYCRSADSARTWSDPAKIDNIGTAEKPWVVMDHSTDRWTLAWTGVDYDPNIYWARHNGIWYDPSTGGPLTPGQRLIPNRGTSHGPSIASL